MGLRFALPLFALLLAACERDQWDDCVTSAGSLRTEERSTGTITEVDLSDRIDLVIEERTPGTISVEAGANLLGQVRTEMSGTTLTISNGMVCNWVRSFKPRITVHVPAADLAHLVLRGTGHITCTDTIPTSYFLLEQWGGEGSCTLLLHNDRTDIALHTAAGDCTARGRCGTANLYSGFMGPLDASSLQADVVNVNNSGVADIRCWVTEQLHAQLSDVGDVYYRGEPPIIQSTITGSGELIHE